MERASNGASSEVRLRLKHGEWEVEIACSEDKIKDVVEKVLSTIDSAASSLSTSGLADQLRQLRSEVDAIKESSLQSVQRYGESESEKKSPRSSMTCRGLIESLWAERYLAEERPLAEVHEELARRGYNYDKTAVAHALADMVREGIPTRVGTMRNFRYIQKRPPGNPISDQTA